MKKTFLTMGCAIAALGLLSITANAAIIDTSGDLIYSDNFNDGNTTGWTRYNPNAAGTSSAPYGPYGVTGTGFVMGAGNTYTFPGGNSVKMTSIQVGTASPARVGIIQESISETDFVIGVDLLNWTATAKQVMGVMGRAQFAPKPSPSTGATGYALSQGWYADGYSATLYNKNGTGTKLEISILGIDYGGRTTLSVGGTFDAVGASAYPVNTSDYRILFQGAGTEFKAQLVNLGTGLPMLMNDGFGGLTDTITASDANWADAGVAGIFSLIGSSSAPSTYTSDATFDNFQVNAPVIPEPTTIVAGLGLIAPLLLAFRRRK